MWVQEEDNAAAGFDEDTDSSSDDEGDVECVILENQRDEAYQRLSELGEVSNQLLKEMKVLEIQFQTERCCRENAEALAVRVSQENKLLKRRSHLLMPCINELPENFEEEGRDEVDLQSGGEEELLLESQAKITALQAVVDGLLSKKMQLEQQVEELTAERARLRDQLSQEIEAKDALLRKTSKQNKTLSKIKRVSQLVTEEFTEMSQKLEVEQGLRQQAEDFAHQMLVEKETARGENMVETDDAQRSVELRLLQALEQISHITAALADIQQYYRSQRESRRMGVREESSELKDLRELLERSESERKSLEALLSDANRCAAHLQTEEEMHSQETRSTENKPDEQSMEKPVAPPPIPPPPPPPPAPAVNFQDFLRSRKKNGVDPAEQNQPPSQMDVKTKAVDEMMERIKKGIILRPIKKVQEEDGSWKDQKSEKRKSAIMELKGIMDNMKRRETSRRSVQRDVGESELLRVLQRRRRVMADNPEQLSSTLTQEPGQRSAPAVEEGPWAAESCSAPVLRRLRQNREKRDSRIRESALIVSNEA